MYCPKQFTYVIRQGDNLYQLAKYYQTTVPQILAINPNTDPYNLQVGLRLTICPGENFQVQPGNPNPPSCPNPEKQINLINRMRLAWSQHVYWTRMLIISIAERLKDQDAVTARLLQNPNDIATIFANYYSPDVAGAIAQLLTEHLQIGSALITALRDGKTLHTRGMPMEHGIIDSVSILRLLHKAGYSGPVIVEPMRPTTTRYENMPLDDAVSEAIACLHKAFDAAGVSDSPEEAVKIEKA